MTFSGVVFTNRKGKHASGSTWEVMAELPRAICWDTEQNGQGRTEGKDRQPHVADVLD